MEFTHIVHRIVPNHAGVMCEYINVISYINDTGGINIETCKIIVYKIWEFCIDKKFWISVANIPGFQDKNADAQSRILGRGNFTGGFFIGCWESVEE